MWQHCQLQQHCAPIICECLIVYGASCDIYLSSAAVRAAVVLLQPVICMYVHQKCEMCVHCNCSHVDCRMFLSLMCKVL